MTRQWALRLLAAARRGVARQDATLDSSPCPDVPVHPLPSETNSEKREEVVPPGTKHDTKSVARPPLTQSSAGASPGQGQGQATWAGLVNERNALREDLEQCRITRHKWWEENNRLRAELEAAREALREIN